MSTLHRPRRLAIASSPHADFELMMERGSKEQRTKEERSRGRRRRGGEEWERRERWIKEDMEEKIEVFVQMSFSNKHIFLNAIRSKH